MRLMWSISGRFWFSSTPPRSSASVSPCAPRTGIVDSSTMARSSTLRVGRRRAAGRHQRDVDTRRQVGRHRQQFGGVEQRHAGMGGGGGGHVVRAQCRGMRGRRDARACRRVASSR